MQIRHRNNRVTLVRTVYDPAIKRGRSVSLGSFDPGEPVPPEIDAELRDNEREQLQAVVGKHRNKREQEYEERAALLLALSIRRATRWYERQTKSAKLSASARECREAYSNLLKAMVKAGVGRTRQRRATNASSSGDSGN